MTESSRKTNSPATLLVVGLLCLIAIGMMVYYFVTVSQLGTGSSDGCTPVVIGKSVMCI